MEKITFTVFLLFLLMGQVFSQTSASATITVQATVINPIQIVKTVDLDFGNITGAYTPGSVILSPDGSRIAQGVQISSSFPGSVNPAEAIVTHGSNNYSITLPQSFTLYNQENPDQTVVINQFTVLPETGEVADVIKIGATLNVGANLLSGIYTSSTGFNVTVSYN